MKTRILVVDDEIAIQRFLRIALEAQDFEVLIAGTGQEGLAQVSLNNPELILLDIGLPDLSGLSVLEQLREWSQVPVIVLSVREQEKDKVLALDLGADDYLSKPFGIQELLARIRVALRHSRLRTLAENNANTVFRSGGLSVDPVQRKVCKDSQDVRLTKTEYNLLLFLIKHAGKVLTHRQLLQAIWGVEYLDETHYLQVYISRLRNKLEADPAQPQLFLTESGVGYRLAMIDTEL
jgi:two-component system, OmpR family, KDP operon response regulator KdpE